LARRVGTSIRSAEMSEAKF